MVIPRKLILLGLAGIIVVGAGVFAWLAVQAGGTGSSMPVAQPSAQTPREGDLENFFGGDPHRDIRNGQEMKPRW